MKIESSSAKNLNGEGLKIAIVLSRFNDSIGSKLHENAKATLIDLNVEEANISTIRVPGSLELPLACKTAAEAGQFDAIIALGIVLRGGTIHYELVCNESHRGIMNASLQTGVPMIFGVLTAETKEQALERAEASGLNRGKEYAEAAVEMALLMKQLRSNKKDVE
ncbi:MAG TPA: 6,7-dimethyl-8-ribityllumazine synthase [Candidatus Gracilibacteria bacterium]|nr:6,7-dimethyl-8-ribityllumazine synthase [Candidatus Gracilibacteria bacterium]